MVLTALTFNMFQGAVTRGECVRFRFREDGQIEKVPRFLKWKPKTTNPRYLQQDPRFTDPETT